MIFQPDPLNPITLQSEYNIYNPRLPLTMNFPGDFCGDNDNIMLIVGKIPKVFYNWLDSSQTTIILESKISSGGYVSKWI